MARADSVEVAHAAQAQFDEYEQEIAALRKVAKAAADLDIADKGFGPVVSKGSLDALDKALRRLR